MKKIVRPFLSRLFVKFCLVGLSGVGVNLGLLWCLTEILGLFYLCSAAISVEISIISNFLLNEFWTFSGHGRSSPFGRLLKFNLISLVGLAINLFILALLTEVGGLHYLLSATIAIGIVTAWNYLTNIAYTWRLRDEG